MNTAEFLTALEQRLGSLPQEERSRALSYFDELFTDMMQEEGLSQEEAVARLEPVEAIAARILEESPRAHQRAAAEQEGVIRTLEAKTQGIRNIKVAARDMPIRVQAGEEDRISIRYPVDEHTRFDITTQGGGWLLCSSRGPGARFSPSMFSMPSPMPSTCMYPGR